MVLKSPLERDRSSDVPRRPTADNPTSTVEAALAYVKQHAGVSDYNDLTNKPTLGSAAAEDTTAFATAAQGAKADTAAQSADLAAVALSGSYNDLTNKPTLGTAAAENVGAFATAAQGALADTAAQSADLATVATSGSYNDLTDKPSAGTGDVVGPASSTDSRIALFDGTTGKLLKDGGKGIPSGAIVGTTDTQTLTNKTLTDPIVGTQTAGDNSTKAASTAYVDGATREKLTADRTYYVRTDGSDSNNGLSNTSGGAFLTIQKAVDVTAALDISVYNVTIQVGAGTYTGGATITGPWVGSGNVTLVGDTTTPSNVLINTSGQAVTLSSGARLNLGGFKISTSNHGIAVNSFSDLNINGAMEYGTCSLSHIAVVQSSLAIRADYTISGGCNYHWDIENLSFAKTNSRTITVTGTPAWTLGFVTCIDSFLLCNLITFSGSATGVRYRASFNGIINTNGGGASYFPGSSAGILTTPAVYL